MFGVLAIDKPAGMTSRDVVNRVQRIVKPIKCGHTGTLDPLATGVLLVAVGPATRLVEFSHDLNKSYSGDFRLGYQSDTLDIQGEVTELPAAPSISAEQLRSELEQWVGEIRQVPPKYSALNVQGKRAHQLAREGKSFELPSRRVQIQQLELTKFCYPEFQLHIECSTGTYIRTLGSDVARKLGSDAVMTNLVRTRIGGLRLSACTRLEHLDSQRPIESHLHSPLYLLSSLRHVVLPGPQCEQLRNGVPITLSSEESGPLAAVDEDGKLVAVIQRGGARFRSLRVFPNANQKSLSENQP